MKKYLITIGIITLFITSLMRGNKMDNAEACINKFKVIKIVDADTFYIDYNKDGYTQKNEKVRIKHSDGFETSFKKPLDRKSKYLGLTKNQSLLLGYMGKNFAEKHLLNKTVTVIVDPERPTDRYNRKLVTIIYDKNKDYEVELLKSGLAVIYNNADDAYKYKKYENVAKIKENAQNRQNLNLVVLNTQTGEFHKLGCPETANIKYAEIIEEPNIPGYHKPKCCYKNQKPDLDIIEKPVADITTPNLTIFFIDGYKYKKPSSKCRTSACQALLSEINHAQKSIYFSIYGLGGQNEILQALIRAQRRGVDVKGTVDMTEKNINIYDNTENMIRQLKFIKNDYQIADKNVRDDFGYKFDITAAIMHDKFFIFDAKRVFTGSANISNTCIGGYNTNVSLLIDSPKVADLYTQEFKQMYNLKFHTIKSQIDDNTNVKIDNNTTMSVYFAPKHQVFRGDLHKILSSAQKNIYVEMFYLTNKFLVNDLIEAKKRGVDVKVIVDAVSAANKYSGHHKLREAGIPVKTENWGGKMHSKAATIDDKYYIIGSMNWTGKAELHNDENLLIIDNSNVAIATKKHFFKLWNVIPDKFLHFDPAPEGPDSIGSCMDGIDNNYNGYTDFGDFKCRDYLIKLNQK